MKKLFTFLFAVTLSLNSMYAQSFPNPALVGYWETWGNITLSQIHANYNVIDIAFAVTKGSSLYDMEMADYSSIYTKSAFLADIDKLHAQNKIVILSIGGANDPVFLNSATEKATFVTSMTKILTDHNDKFDGIDIDLEAQSIKNFPSTWTMSTPATQQQYLIDGIKEVMAAYKTRTGKKLFLTFAPETYYVQGGLAPGQISGAGGAGYLPILEALKNDIDMLHCQLYNVGGGNIAIDGKLYNEGTGDFIVAMTETVIKGFTVLNGKGIYSGLPASKVGFGLPSCAGTGSSGAVGAADICLAAKYLRGVIAKPNGWNYTTTSAYPDLRGMMTWDVNIDQASCGNSFATTFTCAFNNNTSINEISENTGFNFFPNPVINQINIEVSNTQESGLLKIFNVFGQLIFEKQINQQKTTADIADLSPGIYTIAFGNTFKKFIKE